MNEKVRDEILNLLMAIFEDDEYNIARAYLETGRYNELRVFVNEKYEYLCSVRWLAPSAVMDLQVNMCDRLEDLVINAFLGENV